MRDGVLVKPDEGPSGIDPFLEPGDSDDFGYDYGSQYRILARPHMHSYDGDQNWLHPDEPFVLDLGHLTYGIEDKQVTMVVLVNFEPVPFKVFEVSSPDAYPSLSEIENTESTTLRKTRTRVDGEPFNYTLAVPPESFERGAGLYDVRVLFVPSPAPSDTPGMAQILSGTDGYAYQVYFGGCSPTPTANVVDVDGTMKTWSVMTKNFVGLGRGMFLAPPTDVYDWENVSRPDEAELQREFFFEGETLRLTFYGLMFDLYVSAGVNTEDMVFVLFEDDEVIRRVRYTPTYTENTGREFFRTVEELKALEFEVSTAGKQSAQYTVMALSNPMGDPAFGSNMVLTSNTLSFSFR